VILFCTSQCGVFPRPGLRRFLSALFGRFDCPGARENFAQHRRLIAGTVEPTQDVLDIFARVNKDSGVTWHVWLQKRQRKKRGRQRRSDDGPPEAQSVALNSAKSGNVPSTGQGFSRGASSPKNASSDAPGMVRITLESDRVTREESKNNFIVALLNEMNPDSTYPATPMGAQIFGEWIVRVNSKKHRNGDRIIVRIGRGASAKKAEWWVKSVYHIDHFDPSVRAKEVARYLRIKMGETAAS
jgi:hypothetical protein